LESMMTPKSRSAADWAIGTDCSLWVRYNMLDEVLAFPVIVRCLHLVVFSLSRHSPVHRDRTSRSR
jgi:hypothetical protein